MLFVRPVEISDLPIIEEMAVESGIGVTSLPNNRERLFEKIRHSVNSFDHEATAEAGYESYMFVLEKSGKVVGTAALNAAAGFDEPFYSYRSETFVHASRALGVNNRIHALNMCHDLTGMVQLCGFHVRPKLAARDDELLSRARLMFIASHRERFGQKIIAEMQGVHDAAGQAPFWDAIGRRFFNMAFPQVEQAFISHSKTFLAELMPTYPIYVPLLSDEAQQCIGAVHPKSERVCQILEKEGFETDQYLDVFDGGAVLTADLRNVETVTRSQSYPCKITHILPEQAELQLLSNQQVNGFRATLAKVFISQETAFVDPNTAKALQLESGSLIRVAGLQPT